jgi:hypothetical protein
MQTIFTVCKFVESFNKRHTVEPGFNEQKAFQRLNLRSREFNSYGSGGLGYTVIICLINNDSEHSPYPYE